MQKITCIPELLDDSSLPPVLCWDCSSSFETPFLHPSSSLWSSECHLKVRLKYCHTQQEETGKKESDRLVCPEPVTVLPKKLQALDHTWKSSTREQKCCGDSLSFAKRKASRCYFLAVLWCALSCTTKLTFLEDSDLFSFFNLVHAFSNDCWIHCLYTSFHHQNVPMQRWCLTTKTVQGTQFPINNWGFLGTGQGLGKGTVGTGFLERLEGSTWAKEGSQWVLL